MQKVTDPVLKIGPGNHVFINYVYPACVLQLQMEQVHVQNDSQGSCFCSILLRLSGKIIFTSWAWAGLGNQNDYI